MNLRALLIGCVLSAPVVEAAPAVSIAAGYHHALALLSDGKVVAWGLENDNNGGCIAPVNGLADVQAIAAGGYQSCVLKKTNKLLMCGDIELNDVPSGVEGNIKTITGSAYADAAILKDSSVAVFGGSSFGYKRVPSGLKAIQIAGAFHCFVAIRKDSTVVAWGEDAGKVAIPSGLREVIAVAPGYHHVLALKKDGTVVAWGGSGTSARTAVPSGLVAKAIAASEHFSVAVRTNGTVVVWGTNDAKFNVPSGLSDVVAVAAGWSFILALKSNGEVVAWGDNSAGQCRIPAAITAATKIALNQSDFSLLLNNRMPETVPSVFSVNGRAISGAYAHAKRQSFPAPSLMRTESGKATVSYAR